MFLNGFFLCFMCSTPSLPLPHSLYVLITLNFTYQEHTDLTHLPSDCVESGSFSRISWWKAFTRCILTIVNDASAWEIAVLVESLLSLMIIGRKYNKV